MNKFFMWEYDFAGVPLQAGMIFCVAETVEQARELALAKKLPKDLKEQLKREPDVIMDSPCADYRWYNE